MDSIPFVKVSIEEAKAALQKEAIKKEVSLPQKKDWSGKRTPPDRHSPDLAPATFKWMASLPSKTRPYELAKQFPRIANRLAETWPRPVHCERYLDELMMDSRGDRQGFPADVAAEIAALKVHFLRAASTVHYGVWGNRIGVD
ncbi:MAG TPA: hypothetical protein VGE12_21010 [Noviherbaspirillum sp.]